MEDSTLTTVLSSVTEVFTEAIGWVGQVGTMVAETPLMLLVAVLGIGGIAISYFKRLT